MPDDTKSSSPAPPDPGKEPAAATPFGGGQPPLTEKKPSVEPVAPAQSPAPGAARPLDPSKAPDSAKPAPPPKPPEKAAAPAKPAGPVPVPWDSPAVEKLKRQFGSAMDASAYLGQNYLDVDRDMIPGVLLILRDAEQFDYCVDVTAVHWPERQRQFEVVWILYSFARNQRVRVRTRIKDGETLPSCVDIWPTANWLEREVFDMFGIRFEGHPDLKRILLPDGWNGYPLRKDYGIIQQDNEWVKINLGIESGQ